MRWISWILLTLLAAAAGGAALAAQTHLVGTVDYSEELTLPPGAVLEVVLEDVTDADAPAREVGHSTSPDPGSPPFAFDIAYDPAAIDPGRAYSVRAQVSVGRKLVFVSDGMNPVLTRGAPPTTAVRMIKVGETAAETGAAPASIGAHGLMLPASFDGDLPCTDCAGIRYRLNLWSDQVFHMRRTWLGTDERRDSIGRWSVDPDQHVLELRGADEDLSFRILGSDKLELLARDDAAGGGATGGGNVERNLLTAAPALEPFEPHLPLRGMLTYMGDDARFTECLTGRDYPLIQDGDYAALEHAYLAAGAEPGGPIMASFDGGIVKMPKGSKDKSGILVERFVGVWPDETCERAEGAATLTNTYWKILRLGATEVAAGEGRREPNLILRDGDERFTATVGCQPIAGSYRLSQDRLQMAAGPADVSSCPAPLDEWEKQLARTLQETAGWRIDGQTLELLDASKATLALLQAVYLY
ncbi:MAG: YbaY family lipoprotein [Amaricoccus sp.]